MVRATLSNWPVLLASAQMVSKAVLDVGSSVPPLAEFEVTERDKE
jgi:hypothetical protein